MRKGSAERTASVLAPKLCWQTEQKDELGRGYTGRGGMMWQGAKAFFEFVLLVEGNT